MYVPTDSGLAGLGASNVFQKMRAEQLECGKFGPGPDRDACMIRKGYQKTGPNSYSRSTGLNPAKLIPIAALIPVIGGIVSTVAQGVSALQAAAAKAPPDLPPEPVAMVATPTVSVPGPAPAAAVAAATPGAMPSWLLPVLFGAGVLAVVTSSGKG